MTRIAFVETYPYEAVWGGDAVYLDRIRAYLSDRGHTVDSYVTNVTRGRSNPTVKLRTQASINHRWHVRNAVRLGEGRYCSLDPRLIGKALRRLPRGRAAHDNGLDEVEAEWVCDQLQVTSPDLAILAFGACAFADYIVAGGTRVLALKGFFNDRRIRLGEELPTPFVAPALLNSLGQATRVGFNNRYDLDHYARLSGRDNGMLVGMGFTSRPQPAPGGEPKFLFVAARSKPNFESLDWFLTHVWPEVHAAAPGAALRIVGSVGTEFTARQFPGVTFVGFVDQLDLEYRNAWAAVAPLVSGSSGVKTKIAEALSFGRPVITTSLGVDPGDPGQYGDAVVVADDTELFAAALLRIVEDPAYRRERLDDAATQFERHLSEKSAYRELVELIETPLGERRAAFL